MSTAVVPVSSAEPEPGDGTKSSILNLSTLVVGGNTYYERPENHVKSACEQACGSCCYTPELITYYFDPNSKIQIGEKDGKKCCCCVAPPVPPKGELHPGYQIVGRGTLNPWKKPFCFCLGATPMMPDPSLPEESQVESNKTYYVPTAVVRDINGAVVFETRIRSTDQNICGTCKACVAMKCCKPKWCGLCCFSCCGPCCEGCFQCSSCCKCKSCTGCCKCCAGPCAPCEGVCEMACPACYGCCFAKFDPEPQYVIENQPIFKPMVYKKGEANLNEAPVGYIKSVWMDSKPFSVTIDVPGATADEQSLLLILAWAILEKTDPLDPMKVGFIHDSKTNFTNQYFTTLTKGVHFDDVLKMVNGDGTGGAPESNEMMR